MPNRPAKILLVDDDPATERLLSGICSADHFSISGRNSIKSAIEALGERWDLAVVDNLLVDGTGLEFLDICQKTDPDLPLIIISRANIAQTTIEAMKRGAFDCLRKPIDLGLLQDRVEAAYQSRQQAPTTMIAQPRSAGSELPTVLVGETERMLRVFKDVGRLAATSDPVLIIGESGTGKESVARCIHGFGADRDSPFATIYCPGFIGNELERQLENQLATIRDSGGTIFLQEIADLAVTAQSQLLAWLRRGTFEVSSTSGRPGIRLMATSTRPLEHRVTAGEFRADLFYLLSAHLIEVPPLRQRTGDIPILTGHILRQRYPERSPRVSEEAMRLLSSHVWPGNIDELTNVLRRSVVQGNGQIIADSQLRESLRRRLTNEPHDTSHGDHLTNWGFVFKSQCDSNRGDLYATATEEMDTNILPIVLEHTGGNQSEAARVLGMTRASLRKKLRVLGLAVKRKSVES
jgi:DNA-binding NtrC family response regulator